MVSLCGMEISKNKQNCTQTIEKNKNLNLTKRIMVTRGNQQMSARNKDVEADGIWTLVAQQRQKKLLTVECSSSTQVIETKQMSKTIVLSSRLRSNQNSPFPTLLVECKVVPSLSINVWKQLQKFSIHMCLDQQLNFSSMHNLITIMCSRWEIKDYSQWQQFYFPK